MIDLSKIKTTDGAQFDPETYEVMVRPLSDDEGGGWLAEIPSLPGCTGDGDTEMEAIRDVRLAAIEWANCATNFGDPVPPPLHRNPIAAE